MFVEVLNALFITFAATELHLGIYSPGSNVSSKGRRNDVNLRTIISKSPHLIPTLICIAIINIVSRYNISLKQGEEAANSLKMAALHHRFFIAATAFTIVLGWDCRKISKGNANGGSEIEKLGLFLKRLGLSTLKMLPVYPLFAVIIAFCFVFLIDICDALNIPFQWLNDPVYYGILYGPFSAIYWDVKWKYLYMEQGLPT
mmetsp:Transcript_2922/g.3423  ORF Transcript_2922/g.3423 Transcript_2922/m.3423 type:complete len:201 (+) Transcript_2922:321-923(+)